MRKAAKRPTTVSVDGNDTSQMTSELSPVRGAPGSFPTGDLSHRPTSRPANNWDRDRDTPTGSIRIRSQGAGSAGRTTKDRTCSARIPSSGVGQLLYPSEMGRLPFSLLLLLLITTGGGSAASEPGADEKNETQVPSSDEALLNLKRRCRQNPTWKSSDGSISFEECRKAWGYRPRSLPQRHFGRSGTMTFMGHWAHFWEDNHLDLELEREMEACVGAGLKDIIIDDDETMFDPSVKEKYPDPADDEDWHPNDMKPMLVHIKHALTETEVKHLEVLQRCVQNLDPQRHEYRPFHEDGGGNTVTFLSTLLQMFLPGIASQVYSLAHLAQEEAKWPEPGFEKNGEEDPLIAYDPRAPDFGSLGLRTTEYLSYEGDGQLGLHTDSGSIYTVLVALADPEDYDGGEFEIYWDKREDSGHKRSFKPEKLSAVVFLSEELHGVTHIVSGKRKTFANELWMFPDPTYRMLRPHPMDFLDEYVDTLSRLSRHVERSLESAKRVDLGEDSRDSDDEESEDDESEDESEDAGDEKEGSDTKVVESGVLRGQARSIERQSDELDEGEEL